MNKKSIFLIFLIIVFSFFCISCNSEGDNEDVKKGENDVKEVDIDKTDVIIEKEDPEPIEEDIIIIGYDSDWPPYTFLNKNKKADGFDVEVLRAIVTEMGIKFKFEPKEWKKALADLKIGDIHMLPSMDVTQERSKIYLFADSYATQEEVAFSHNDTPNISGDTSEDLINGLLGKTVGIQTGHAIHEKLRIHKEINIALEKSTFTNLEKLNKKEIDFVLDDKLFALYYIKSNNLSVKVTGPSLDIVNYSTGFYKGVGQEFIDKYNKAVAAIKNNGTLDKIYRRWFR